MKIKLYTSNNDINASKDNDKPLKLLKKINIDYHSHGSKLIELQCFYDVYIILTKELDKSLAFCHSFVFWALTTPIRGIFLSIY